MDRACLLAWPHVVTCTFLWTSLYTFHYSVFTAAEYHHIQGLLISSSRGCSTSVATGTQLLNNFPLPATILLVTGPFGALISDLSSLSWLEISLRLLSSRFSSLWSGDSFGSSSWLVLICQIGYKRYLCKILGFALGSP